MKLKLILTIGWVSYCFAYSQAQTAKFHITSGYFNINNTSKMVLNNAKWINDGIFDAGGSVITFTGNSATNLSTIEGNSSTEFYKLVLNKSANDVELKQDISIVKSLELANSSLILNNNDLSLNTSAVITNANPQHYIETNNLGTVKQTITNGGGAIYPVGNGSYTPLSIQNNGTSDEISVRVQNQLYTGGTTGNIVTTEAINRSWIIEENTIGGSNLDVTFSWNDTEELTNFDRNNCFVAAFQAGNWQNNSSQTASGSNPYQITQIGITQLSVFGIVSNAAALPVELLYFTGEKITEGVLLTWETATELNNKGFEVQVKRPSNFGLEWKTLDFVNGNGTTQVSHQYESLDKTPEIGVNYYRLKQIDFDETFSYTDIVAVEYTDAKTLGFNVYPNPATDYLTIEANTHTEIIHNIELYNITGQLVRQQAIDNKTSVLFDIHDLPNGTYIIRINQIVNKKIIKTN